MLLQVAEVLIGALTVLAILMDVFQSVIVPRPIPRGLRATRLLVRGSWALWRRLGLRMRGSDRREHFLGIYAPLAVILLLVFWVAALLFGYGLVLHGLRAQVQPRPEGMGSALYFSGVALFTLGYGDFVPTGGLARTVTVAAAGSGLGVMAVVITYLFSLYASFQRREALVVTLAARAGAPPSGVTLLETSARFGMLDDLRQSFASWEKWSAEVLESHLAYPILAYFRSSHDNESWISSLGAMLDAATLVLTTIEDGPWGEAHMMHSIGRHLVLDLTSYFRLTHEHEAGVERLEYEQARERLAASGFNLRADEDAWLSFARLRSDYAGPLNALARHWSIPPAQWIGDRSSLPHSRHPLHD